VSTDHGAEEKSGRNLLQLFPDQNTNRQSEFKEEHWCLPIMALKKKVASTYSNYFQIKTQTDNHNTWLGQLIAAQALAKNTTKQWLWKQI